MPDVLKIREVADYLRVSQLTIKRYCKRGLIKYSRINSRGDRRITKEAVINFLDMFHEKIKS